MKKVEDLASATRFLVFALSALYGLAAITGLVVLDFETTEDVILWLLFLVGGAIVMLAGELAAPAGRGRAFLVSVGTAAGGIPLFWTLIVPVAVAAVVAGSIALARRSSAPA